MTSSIHCDLSESRIKEENPVEENPDEEIIIIPEDEDDWHSRLVVGMNKYATIDNGPVLIELMKKYKTELKTKLKGLNKAIVKEHMVKHVNNIHLYQAAVTDLCREDYLNEMVEILTFLCNYEMESSIGSHTDSSETDHTSSNNNEIEANSALSKSAHLKDLEVAQRINNYLTIYLFGEEMYIEHVLMKIKPIRHSVLNYIFQHFLVREVKDTSDEGFCRAYILLLKWKEISPQTMKKEQVNELSFLLYKRTCESIKTSDYLKKILVPSYTSASNTFLHIINSTASLTNKYFQNYKKVKKVNEIQAVIDVPDSSDDDITQVTYDDITNFRPIEEPEPELVEPLADDVQVVGAWETHEFTAPSISEEMEVGGNIKSPKPPETDVEVAPVATEDDDTNVYNVLVPENMTEVQQAWICEVKIEPETVTEQTATEQETIAENIQNGQITPPPTPARDEAQISSEPTKETVDKTDDSNVDSNVVIFNNVSETSGADNKEEASGVVESAVDGQITHCEQNSVSSIELKTPSDVSDGEDSGGSDKDSGFFGSDRVPNSENDENSQKTRTEQKQVIESQNWDDNVLVTVLSVQESREYFQSNNNSSPNSPVTLETPEVSKEVEIDHFSLNGDDDPGDPDGDDEVDEVDEDLLLAETEVTEEVTEEIETVIEENGVEEEEMVGAKEVPEEDEFEPLFKLLRKQGVFCVPKVTQMTQDEESERIEVTKELRQSSKPTLLYESPSPLLVKKNLGDSDITHSMPLAKRSKFEEIHQPVQTSKKPIKRTIKDDSTQSAPATKRRRGRPKRKVHFLI